MRTFSALVGPFGFGGFSFAGRLAGVTTPPPYTNRVRSGRGRGGGVLGSEGGGTGDEAGDESSDWSGLSGSSIRRYSARLLRLMYGSWTSSRDDGRECCWCVPEEDREAPWEEWLSFTDKCWFSTALAESSSDCELGLDESGLSRADCDSSSPGRLVDVDWEDGKSPPYICRISSRVTLVVGGFAHGFAQFSNLCHWDGR